MKPKSPPFDYRLGRALGRTGKLLERDLLCRMEEAGRELKLEHIIVLRHLWLEDGLNQNSLGISAGKNKTAVTRTVDWLEKKNFVQRITDDKDRRNKLVFLTQSGKDLRSELEPLLKATLALAVRDIPREALASCIEILMQIQHNLDPDEDCPFY